MGSLHNSLGWSGRVVRTRRVVAGFRGQPDMYWMANASRSIRSHFDASTWG